MQKNTKEQRTAHKQIRDSQEVFNAIQAEAIPLIDSPDTVLRRKFKITNEKKEDQKNSSKKEKKDGN